MRPDGQIAYEPRSRRLLLCVEGYYLTNLLSKVKATTPALCYDSEHLPPMQVADFDIGPGLLWFPPPHAATPAHRLQCTERPLTILPNENIRATRILSYQ